MAGIVHDLTPIECSICKDTLDDPRALPCGHSYCGLPKNCLRGVQKESGLICAVCKEEFHLQIYQLKPLYGNRDYIQQTTTSAEKVCSVKNDGCLQIMCKHHVNSQVMFWCKACEEKCCTECFDSKHQSHHLISFTQFLKQKVDSVYKRSFGRVKFIQGEAMCLTQNLQKINADNDQTQLINSCVDELLNFTTEWKSVTEFTENPKAEVDLNVIESFISQSFEELDAIETRLKEIKISNLGNFRFSTQITFFMPTNNQFPFEIGSVKVPHKDELDISFTIKFRQNPDAFILVESFVNKKSGCCGAGIQSMLGNIEIGLPFLDYKAKIMTENKHFSGQWKNEHRFGELPAFTLGESFLLSFGCDFVFEKMVQKFHASPESSCTSFGRYFATPNSYPNVFGESLANPNSSPNAFVGNRRNPNSSPNAFGGSVANPNSSSNVFVGDRRNPNSSLNVFVGNRRNPNSSLNAFGGNRRNPNSYPNAFGGSRRNPNSSPNAFGGSRRNPNTSPNAFGGSRRNPNSSPNVFGGRVSNSDITYGSFM